MSQATWTQRQQREASYYEQYAARQQTESVDFTPVSGRERRPWNPYWYVYACMRHRYVGPWQRMLDFGCGVGIAAVRAAYVGYQVDGFDIAQANIDAAARLAAHHGYQDRCRFQRMIAEKLDYPDNTFDLIAGIDILHHVDIPAALAEAHRVLKPGGLAVFKEHIEVPLVDRIRNSAVVLKIAPNEESLDHHITQDERKLNADDLQLIRRTFDTVEVERFTVVSRLDRLLPPGHEQARRQLQRLDHRLMKVCPPLAQLGGTVVCLCTKRQVSQADVA
jgi:ubiquinone/menaquinone biosynthesis C-methylase UbiE